MTELWTDGSCLKNPLGPGGWGLVVRREGMEQRFNGHAPSTTNNRMEMTAVLEALRCLDPGEAASVHSDSQLLIKGCSEWMPGWKRKGWRKADGNPVLNQDLWHAIDVELERVGRRAVKFVWVRGHVGNVLNELADELAGMGARGHVL